MANTKNKKTASKGESHPKDVEYLNDSNARLISIIIFALSVLFFFIAILKGESVWQWLHNTYIGLFGWVAAIIFPILSLVLYHLFLY